MAIVSIPQRSTARIVHIRMRLPNKRWRPRRDRDGRFGDRGARTARPALSWQWGHASTHRAVRLC
jgi:hypothetical protein